MSVPPQLDQLAELTDKYCVVFQTIQIEPEDQRIDQERKTGTKQGTKQRAQAKTAPGEPPLACSGRRDPFSPRDRAVDFMRSHFNQIAT